MAIISPRDTWVWMPHAGHLIVGHECRFHLATYIPTPGPGGVIVSTVGEWWPDSTVREIMAKTRGIQLQGRGDERDSDFMRQCGFVEIGYDRIYETMVFTAERNPEPRGQCCPYRMADASGLDMAGYSDAAQAYDGHLALCDKWASLETIDSGVDKSAVVS